MSENGEKKFQKVLEGINYLIGDNKILREELRESAKSAEQDRRRADEDRRRADEDRRRADEKFERLMEKSDVRFATLLDQVKRTNRVAVDIARDLRAQQKQLLDGQDRTNKLLDDIRRRLPPPTNGH